MLAYVHYEKFAVQVLEYHSEQLFSTGSRWGHLAFTLARPLNFFQEVHSNIKEKAILTCGCV
jgi:hypothetical protein